MKFFTIDGKKFILNKAREKNGKYEMKLVPYNEAEYQKIVSDIATKVAKAVDKETLVRQALSNLEYTEILAMHKTLMKERKKPKATEGCYNVEFGKHKLYLVG